MPARFCVLASGSSGNCAFLQAGGFGLLIDVGLAPRLLAARLADVGASWRNVHAVLLTHTHSDHWKARTLAHLHALGIPFYCSPRHYTSLARHSEEFTALAGSGLVRDLADAEPFVPIPGVTCRAFSVPHDSDPTFAYRIDGPSGLFDHQWSLGYASDLGEMPATLVEAFTDVSTLAIEFNHCERMQRASRRPRFLIDRVLGPHGHLSNPQAADAVRAVARAGFLRHLVQLHLSRECNRPSLAASVGRAALAEASCGATVTTASQYAVSRVISLDGDTRRPRPARAANGTG